METDIPIDLRCPISHDIMNDPVTVTHRGIDFNFDRNCIETWKTTSGGDQNPLTMLDGFRDAPIKDNLEIKEKIRVFRIENGIDTNQIVENIILEPFCDFQQIQDDEAEARRLNDSLNEPSPIRTSDGRIPNQVRVTWINEQGENQQRVVNLPVTLVRLMDSVPEYRTNIMNNLVKLAINPDTLPTGLDQDINLEGPIEPEPIHTSQPLSIIESNIGIIGFRGGFLN